MKVKRTIVTESDQFAIGDVISFKLKTREKVEAIAVEKDEAGTTFCFVDCLHQESPMNQTDTTEGGYDKSLLRRVLNREILDLFPDEIRRKMKPVYRNDLLKIPSEMEIFGKNEYAREGEEGVKQWEPMKDRRNRIAWQGCKTGVFEWYCLRDVVSSTAFAYVNFIGYCNNDYVSYSHGIRPAFKI